MAKLKSRRKSHTIEEAGVRVRVFRRGDRYWLDVRHGSERNRLSAETADRATAEVHARALAREIASRSLLGVTADTLALGQLLAAYDEHKAAGLAAPWQRRTRAHARHFLAAWGAEFRVVALSQTSVDAYARARRTAWATARDGAKLRDGALDCDFRWLSSVLNWAHRHKLPSGKRLLHENPLQDCTWPREKHVRRPVSSEDRFARTMAVAQQVDLLGRFRLALALARYTGHRITAILRLRASDVLLTPDRIAEALAAAGADDTEAALMPHGALRWASETDKTRQLHIAPISGPMRAELEGYLASHPRIGDVPLLPSDEIPGEPVPRSTASKWLPRAEKLAQLPKITGGLWHPYRRLWVTQRKNLPDVDVAKAGGWKGTKAMKLAYQHATPEGVLAAVNAN